MLIVLAANGVRLLMTMMTGLAKEGSRSKRNRLIIGPIFVQYCITYILVPIQSTWIMDDEDSLYNKFNLFKKGLYNDFNSNWFMDVGQNVYEIMKFNIYMPIITFLTTWAMRYALRWSPDGERIAFSDKHGKLYVVDVSTKGITEVADDPEVLPYYMAAVERGYAGARQSNPRVFSEEEDAPLEGEQQEQNQKANSMNIMLQSYE